MIQEQINDIFRVLISSIYSNKKLAEVLGVSDAMASRIVNGNRNATIDHLQKIAQHVNAQITIEINPFDIEWKYN